LILKTKRVQNSVEICIGNSSHGIPEETYRKLFKEPIPKRKDEKGSGMGLLMAQQIIETYQGEIQVISAGPPVTEFGISLPLEVGNEYAR
jgi:sensor histidine kinase regulating citrate/malate metabolism